MTLKAVAIAAPDWIAGKGKSNQTINSADPASLFNACRYAALLADQGIGEWGTSNWACVRAERRKKVLLMYSLEEDINHFESLILKEKPNLLLIGAMTLCFPGAIACAKLARNILGDQVYIVLGGRHATETIYFSNQYAKVLHHVASPLFLMLTKQIDPLFDLVISGDGEYIIAKIGELIGQLDEKKLPFSKITSYFSQLGEVPGKWIIGWIEKNTLNIKSDPGIPIDYDQLPSPCSMFGVNTAFDVFDGRLTAHVFSDTGRGCAYDCTFCSERRSVAGNLLQLNTSARRLYKQLRNAYDTITGDNSLHKASAFVEDSLLLAGNIRAFDELIKLLEKNPLDIKFGAQLTIDQILHKKDYIIRLNNVGLSYFFIGLETFSPDEIGGMSKDTKRQSSWLSRAERAFEFLTSINIGCGAAILFGLGESHKSRMALLKQIELWRKQYNLPSPISMNWAVQHPLNGQDGGANYNYIEWGTPKGPFLDLFHDFGEASLLYPIVGVPPPILEEVYEVQNYLSMLNTKKNIISKSLEDPKHSLKKCI